MSKLDQTKSSVTINFHGADLSKHLEANPNLKQAVWDLCTRYTDASIRIDVAPRMTDANPVEWTFCATSPKGRQTVLLTQRKPGGHVSITPA